MNSLRVNQDGSIQDETTGEIMPNDGSDKYRFLLSVANAQVNKPYLKDAPSDLGAQTTPIQQNFPNATQPALSVVPNEQMEPQEGAVAEQGAGVMPNMDMGMPQAGGSESDAVMGRLRRSMGVSNMNTRKAISRYDQAMLDQEEAVKKAGELGAQQAEYEVGYAKEQQKLAQEEYDQAERLKKQKEDVFEKNKAALLRDQEAIDEHTIGQMGSRDLIAGGLYILSAALQNYSSAILGKDPNAGLKWLQEQVKHDTRVKMAELQKLEDKRDATKEEGKMGLEQLDRLDAEFNKGVSLRYKFLANQFAQKTAGLKSETAKAKANELIATLEQEAASYGLQAVQKQTDADIRNLSIQASLAETKAKAGAKKGGKPISSEALNKIGSPLAMKSQYDSLRTTWEQGKEGAISSGMLGAIPSNIPGNTPIKEYNNMGDTVAYQKTYRQSGAQVSDAEHKKRRALFPYGTDTLEQGTRKIDIQQYDDFSNTAGKIISYGNSGYDTTGLRAEFAQATGMSPEEFLKKPVEERAFKQNKQSIPYGASE